MQPYADVNTSHRSKHRPAIIVPNNNTGLDYAYEIEDPVIEQWYADPYARPDPDKPAHIQQRRQNLENTLGNQGFGHARILPIVNWLMRCNGNYRDFNNRKGREKRGCRKRTFEQRDRSLENSSVNDEDATRIEQNLKRPRLDPQTNIDGDRSNSLDTLKADGSLESDLKTRERRSHSPPDGIIDPVDDLARIFSDENLVPTTYELHQILGTEVETHVDKPQLAEEKDTIPEERAGSRIKIKVEENATHYDHELPGVVRSTIDRKSLVKALQARLRFWDIIYGKPPNCQLPDIPSTTAIHAITPENAASTNHLDALNLDIESDNPSVQASTFECETKCETVLRANRISEPEFTWFHTPTPRLILPPRTQNHLPLQQVIFNNISCDTEDPTFGLYIVPELERMTKEEQREWDELNRQRLREQERKEREAEDRRLREELELEMERECGWGGATDDGWRRNVGSDGRGSWMTGSGSFSNGYRETWREIETQRKEAELSAIQEKQRTEIINQDPDEQHTNTETMKSVDEIKMPGSFVESVALGTVTGRSTKSRGGNAKRKRC